VLDFIHLLVMSVAEIQPKPVHYNGVFTCFFSTILKHTAGIFTNELHVMEDQSNGESLVMSKHLS